MGTALITGGSSGIGAEYASRLADRGWDLVLVARRGERLADLGEQLRDQRGIQVEELVADLSDPADLPRVAERAAGDDIDLLINNAGINGYGPFAETDPGLQEKVIGVNVTAVTALSRAALPGMLARGRGTVINVASLLAFSGDVPPNPLPQRVVYGATKAYEVAFTRILAAELDGSPVGVQVVCPGLTATEFHLTQGDEPVAGRAPQVHDDGGMPAPDVVTASLAAFDSGETVCIPGLSEPAAVARLAEAEAELRSASRSGLAERYGKSARS
jgi:short-subunit dehydrogenase